MQVVSVDPTKCQGHARCLAFAPNVFDFDDEGYAFVPEDRASFEVVPSEVMLALTNCPERAISLTEVANP